MSEQSIVGPFGFWRFPILNAILQRLQSSSGMDRIRFFGQIPQRPQPALPAPQEVARSRNLETWTWIDYKGHERQITVHRDVEQTG